MTPIKYLKIKKEEIETDIKYWSVQIFIAHDFVKEWRRELNQFDRAIEILEARL